MTKRHIALIYRRGESMTWSAGRRLTEIDFNEYGDLILFDYDGRGLRTRKEGPRVYDYNTAHTPMLFIIDYYYDDNGMLVYERRSENGDNASTDFTIEYFYGLNGIAGFNVLNGTSITTYFYVKNVLGDVLGITDSNGTLVAEYRYDAYGKPVKILDGNGNDVSTNYAHIANINPIRYRGYYYDIETEFYYLQSRYYDPETGRFINADSQLNGYSILGYNLFAYCENNPIMHSDPTGHAILSITVLGVLVVGMSVGFTASSPINNSTVSNIQYNSKEHINPNVPPNPESGYIPPKKNPNPSKVRNPNGEGKGWPSNNGGVWVPNNKQDGGPGWTVQFPDGSHEHRYPDGHVRSHKFSNSYNNTTDVIIGGSTIAVAGIGIIFIMADDVTVIGALDDVSLPVLFSVFTKGMQMVAG